VLDPAEQRWAHLLSLCRCDELYRPCEGVQRGLSCENLHPDPFNDEDDDEDDV